MNVAIALRDLTFGHGDRAVLENVDLEIETGSFVSVIGPNGGGKSTLLKLILGLLEPDAGTVRVLGRSPDQARTRIGYMPQHQDIDPNFPITVREVVRLGRLGPGSVLGHVRGREHREAVREALETVGCAHLKDRSFSALSGGQRQLVLIARALVSGPELLLLDEPTANLDPAVEESFYRLLENLRGQVTLMLVSHDVGLVSELTDRVVCVNRKVVTHQAREMSSQVIREMFGGAGGMIVDHGHVHHAHTERGEPHP